MSRRNSKILMVLLLLAAAVAACYFMMPAKNKIDFNAQVKPIFNKKCIACHGGVKQQSEFSLLFREEALKKAKSGKYAIVPGDAAQSELIKRIKAKDEEERMPYKHEPLSKEDIAILEQWIDEGAVWGTHWAYIPVAKPAIPDEKNDWIKNNIDRFVFQKLQEEKLTPSAEAEKATLLRRAALDLTGLPPNDKIAQKFLKDNSPQAYGNLIDDLLAAPAYGERWTALWLDLARYADTKGYEADRTRSIWMYRDWLIKAFNADKPYNDFLTEQIAGDLMPGADDDKYIATAFHRNTMTNDEGGTDNEEFRTAAVIDRVNTTWSALMGTTFSCVQCHSHPYDPFTHEEYYKFLAFFNNTRDEDTEIDYPLLRFYNGADSTNWNSLHHWFSQNTNADDSKWYQQFMRTMQPAVNSLRCDNYQNGILYVNLYASLDNSGTCRLPDINFNNKRHLIFRYFNQQADAKLYISLDSVNGKLLNTVQLKKCGDKWKIQMEDLPELTGRHSLYFRYYSPTINSPYPGILFDWFAFAPIFPGAGTKEQVQYSKQFTDLLNAEPETVPVMVESNKEQYRQTHVFDRGNWMVKTKLVEPAVPHIMNAMPANAPANRLGLAMWLTDKKNPLTARTMVNRLWEQLFGTGLAETLEDLGTQGIPPLHKELLDYLAWQFMYEYNWSIKKLLKEIVTSATYRQSSKTTPELLQKDPNNILLARQTRVRLSGEQLRDQALAVSKLLNTTMYGKSVMPWQPEGIWLSPYNGDKWETANDGNQYRRALYTFWKRTAPYPTMINFDGASREVCVTKRIRTNTPLQALNSLNDAAFLVLAKQFAANMIKAVEGNAEAQIKKGYEAMMYKPVSDTKLKTLVGLYNEALAQYKKDKAAAEKLIGVKENEAKPETAAMIVVANAMMNLDEWLNKN
ncbi:MAG TPA: DUF1553 domain-containing protein [Ferruginibacter sp.]|nr:DUF1553 domain-containing protein [Ferruginibacter sp.]HMP20000.1 DUF1553 domain-containing protein [Ferruginibacter sp.]